MNKHDKRAERIKKHLEVNPNDYNAVCNLLEVRSRSYDYENHKKYHEARKEIAEIRRCLRKEERDE